MISTILFDLDGTLLPMDQEHFVKLYLNRMVTYLAPHGYDPNKLLKAIWKGTEAMVGNDGSRTNETVFWDYMSTLYGFDMREAALHLFESFYQTDFQLGASDCGYTPKAAALVRKLKSEGFRVVLATNPIFPSIATESRMRWAGFEPSDFALYTTYERSTYCKPTLEYYQQVLDTIGCRPEECVMVGNDVSEDMVAEKLGMKVFLLTDCLINRHDWDISHYPQGGFDALSVYLDGLKAT